VSQELQIAAKYNGPPNSGNGGYSCGVLAAHVEGAARVRLFIPPPLDTPLQISRTNNDQVDLRDGETLVGSAWPATLDLDIPPAPTLEQAREASTRYAAREKHNFPTCYVCGPARQGDGLCLFPGPVNDWQLLACTWHPREDSLDQQGNIRPEIVWSALDCPGYFAAQGSSLRNSVLGQLTAEIYREIAGQQELVVYCWPLSREGRKSEGGTAIASADGRDLQLLRWRS